jgi:putative hydrolase of the HAD superfamily
MGNQPNATASGARALPPLESIRAVIFDVDGTLYDQRKLRLKMLGALVRAHAWRPLEGWRTGSVLKAYRHAQEELRQSAHEDPAARQAEIACKKTGYSPEFVEQCVQRWMETAPLTHLPACIHAGLVGFLDTCRSRGLRLATLSDYPAEAKLRALGIADAFELALCAQSPEIGRFKPHPRGLVVTLERLGVTAGQALYIGDRPEVDAAAAAAAGVGCAIVAQRSAAGGAFVTVRGYDELQVRLFGAATAAAP